MAVANARYFGGDVNCPQANIFDGRLDVCIVQGMSNWKHCRYFPAFLPAAIPIIPPFRPTAAGG